MQGRSKRRKRIRRRRRRRYQIDRPFDMVLTWGDYVCFNKVTVEIPLALCLTSPHNSAPFPV